MSPRQHEPGVYRMPAQHCFECGKKLDAVAATQGCERDEPPGEGAATMCLGCGAIYGISARLEIRELTMRERAELAGDHDAMGEFRRINRQAHFARRPAKVH